MVLSSNGHGPSLRCKGLQAPELRTMGGAQAGPELRDV